jgi:fatty-acyl-CoA synthase
MPCGPKKKTLCSWERISVSKVANNLFRAFARTVRRFPDVEALTYLDSSWSYAELQAAAVRGGAELQALGVREGDRVAFLGRNSDAYVIGFLAIQVIGAIHVPINFRLQPAEIRYILEHCSPAVLFVEAAFLNTVEGAVTAVHCKPRILPIEDLARPVREVPLIDVGAHRDSSAVAQLAYTSGTESKPKGALLTDNGLVFEYMSCIAAGDYLSSDIVLNALPLYHCAQIHCFLVPALLLGCRNILLDAADPTQIIQAISEYGATSFFAPPTVWIGILNSPAFDPQSLRCLQKGYYGASIMPVEVLARLQEKLPWLRLWNFYGQTEIGPLATALRPEEHATRPASVGRPVLFVETRVVDDDMVPVPLGTVGEIVHRSPQLLVEYYRDPERTAEAFRDGWFRSGDLGVVDEEGYLTVVDRKKDMIKTGGENVASREVEEVIYTHPAVLEVAVVGRPDDKWVERVCAFVVVKPGARLTVDEVVAHAATLAAFKRPKEVIFVRDLPKNPSGKVIKRELRNLAGGSTS